MATLTMISFILSFFLFTLGDISVSDMNLNPMIVGGKRALIEEAPFMALYVLEVDGPERFAVQCGASILSDKFILSAAHCYDGDEENEYFVTVGTDTIGCGQNYQIEKTVVHPKYDDATNDYDVLVIKLIGKIKFSRNVQPIKMADSKLVIKHGAYLDTFGFGKTQFDESSKYLLKVRVPFVSREKCKAAYDEKLTHRMICAGEKGKDSCAGDSGGPLVYGKVLVGVVSYGGECGDPNVPGVYASVSMLRNFIDNVMRSERSS